MKKNKRETTVDSTNKAKVVTKEQHETLLEKYNELEESYKSLKHSLTAYKSANTKYRNVCESLVNQRNKVAEELEIANIKIENQNSQISESIETLKTAKDALETLKHQNFVMSTNNKALADKVCELTDAIEKYNKTPWIKRIFQKVPYNK